MAHAGYRPLQDVKTQTGSRLRGQGGPRRGPELVRIRAAEQAHVYQERVDLAQRELAATLRLFGRFGFSDA